MAQRRPARFAAVATLGAGALVLAGAGGGSAQAAADSTPGYSLQHIHVDTMVGPNGDQPCGITADNYKPDSASATESAIGISIITCLPARMHWIA